MTTQTLPLPDGALLDEAAVHSLFLDARTVQTFTSQEVTDAQVAAAYDLARWAPTAMNTSPLRVALVRSTDARERLVQHMAPGNRDRVLAAPLALVVAADPAFHRHGATLVPHAPDFEASFEPQVETRERMARDNAWLQAGYLLLALRGVGLGVGAMGGMDAAGVDADLFADQGWRTLLVLTVGHPEGEGTTRPRAPRLTFEQASTTL